MNDMVSLSLSLSLLGHYLIFLFFHYTTKYHWCLCISVPFLILSLHPSWSSHRDGAVSSDTEQQTHTYLRICLFSIGRLKSNGCFIVFERQNITSPEIQTSSARMFFWGFFYCLFSHLYIFPSESCHVILMDLEMSAWGKSDNTDLLPSLSLTVIFYQANHLQMFHTQKKEKKVMSLQKDLLVSFPGI